MHMHYIGSLIQIGFGDINYDNNTESRAQESFRFSEKSQNFLAFLRIDDSTRQSHTLHD